MKIDHVDLEILYLVANEPLHFNELWRRLRERGVAISRQGLRSRIEKLKRLNILSERVEKQYKIVSIVNNNIRNIVLAVYRYCEYVDRVLPSITSVQQIQSHAESPSVTHIYAIIYIHAILLHTLLILNAYRMLPEEVYKLLIEKLMSTYLKIYSHFLTLALSVTSPHDLIEFALRLYDNIPVSDEDRELREVLDCVKNIVATVLKTCSTISTSQHSG